MNKNIMIMLALLVAFVSADSMVGDAPREWYSFMVYYWLNQWFFYMRVGYDFWCWWVGVTYVFWFNDGGESFYTCFNGLPNHSVFLH